MLGTILIIILILMLLGALPRWGHSRNWGYGPSGGVGLAVLIIVILVLMGPDLTVQEASRHATSTNATAR